MSGEEYMLPERATVDVTPELISEILQKLPPHEEGHFAVTVQTDSLRRLLEHTGAKVVVGYHQNPHAGDATAETRRHGND